MSDPTFEEAVERATLRIQFCPVCGEQVELEASDMFPQWFPAKFQCSQEHMFYVGADCIVVRPYLPSLSTSFRPEAPL